MDRTNHVWLVWANYGGYNRELIAIFLTEEKANQYVDKLNVSDLFKHEITSRIVS